MEDSPFIHMPEADIPPWDVIERGLAQLDRRLSDNATPEQIREALEAIPLANSQCISLQSKGLTDVYRARQPQAHEDIASISTFSLPPVEHARSGRANKEGCPVFYGSLLTDTAIREVLKPSTDQKNGELVYVGHWRTTAPVNIKQLLHPRQALKNQLMGEFHYGLVEKLRDMLKEYSLKNQVTLERLAGHLGDYFLRDGEDYRVSSLIAHQALYDFNPPMGYQVDAIAYPSIVKDHAAINVVLGPHYASNHLELVEVRKYQVNEIQPDGIDVELLGVGLPDKQRLNWFKPELDLSTLRIVSASIDGHPIGESRGTSQLLVINGVVKECDTVLKQFWKHRRKQIIKHAVEELLKHPFDQSDHIVSIGIDIRNVVVEYEGRALESLMLNYGLQCRWRLNPDGSAIAA